ncbi:MAG: ACP S-malonyltransferase [Pseudomonadota bacterium]
MTLAFMFPGQGSQSVGMLTDWYEQHPAVKATFDEASTALGYDLWQIAAEGPEEQLSSTEVTQPALLTASVAIWRAWQADGGPSPGILAGHSLGEYSALVCAEALNFSAAVQLVRTRGQLMQSAVAPGEGAMAAVIGLDDDVVEAACEAVEDGIVAAANFNAPGQVVIAGEAAAVAAASANCEAGGARRIVPLAVSVPSHSPLMTTIAPQFGEALAEIDIRTPMTPVVNNVYATVEMDPDTIRDALIQQLDHSVQWSACVRLMAQRGATRFAECGPGRVLSGLLRRIHKPAKALALETPSGAADARTLLAEESGT